jgi:hypothetical protein
MSDVENQILERVDVFVAELTELIRQVALETVSEAIGGGSGAPTRGRGRPGKAGPAKSLAPPATAARAKSQKRSTEELERLASDLAAYVKKNAGERAEQIAKGMGVTTKDLQLPVKKLIAAGTIKTKGQKRSTQYFPG